MTANVSVPWGESHLWKMVASTNHIKTGTWQSKRWRPSCGDRPRTRQKLSLGTALNRPRVTEMKMFKSYFGGVPEVSTRNIHRSSWGWKVMGVVKTAARCGEVPWALSHSHRQCTACEVATGSEVRVPDPSPELTEMQSSNWCLSDNLEIRNLWRQHTNCQGGKFSTCV